MVNLIAKTPDELASYFPLLYRAFYDELIQSGMNSEQASKMVEQSKEDSYANGTLSEGNEVFNVVVDGIVVGNLWIAEMKKNEWFISDIEISKEFLRKGFGRQAMEAAEEYVLSKGGTSIALSVFGFNTGARKLYESLNYEVTRLSMKKCLK